MGYTDVGSDPLVSVCIPVYNCQAYVSGAIASVLAQTYKNIEIIVVDDGSSDGSLALLRTFGNQIRLIGQENRGASAARNRAWQAARGDYIQFLDADDLLSADKIEMQVTSLQSAPGHVAVCHTVYFNCEEDRLMAPLQKKELYFIKSTEDPVDFMVRLWGGYGFDAWMVQTNAWLVPRQLIERFGGWDESLTLDDDGEFFAKIILNAAGIRKTGGLNYYRKRAVHKENLSERKNAADLDSYFRSVLQKKKYLLAKRGDVAAQKATFYLLTQLALVCYPVAPALSRQIETELRQLPAYQYRIKIGGAFINFIANTLGWKTARHIQQLYRALRQRQ